MDLIVLLKPVPDMEKVRISRGQGKVFETGKQLLNSYDRVGLQLAVDLKNKHGGKISVISICDLSKTGILREAYASGADHGYNLWEDEYKISDHFVKTTLLAHAIQKIGDFDLVICGARSDYGMSGQTGPRLAEALNIPQATHVNKLKISGENIEVQSSLFSKEKFPMPALITVDKSAAKTTYPNALNIMKAFKKEIIHWTTAELNLQIDDIGEAGSLITIQSTYLPGE